MHTSTMQVMNMQRVTTAILLALLAALGAVSSNTSAAAAAAAGPVRMQLSHADAGRGLTPGELLQRMALHSKTRAARFLSGSSASAPVTPGQHNGSDPSTEYLVHLGIGTPLAQPVQLILDTGSDLVWTQCRPCTTASCFPQALPYFDQSLSSTFVNLTCDSSACQDLRPLSSCVNQACVYNYSYLDNSTSKGQVVADTFVFEAGAQGQTAVPNLSFGCASNNSGIFTANETGIVGFGRGNLSLPSQLKVDNFSYCFTNISGSTPSPVLLGLPANLYGGGGAAVQTTPLIRSSFLPSFYYLQLQSITVGSTTLQVPQSTFALNANGTGGTVIDSGTSITSLPPHVFSLLRDAFVSELNMTPVATKSFGPDVLCFPASTQTTTVVPKLQLQFEGATLDLPQDNYVFTFQDENGQSNMCIAMVSSPGGLNITIIGNYQQQNMHVLYDLAGNKLSFVPAQCDMV